MKGNTHKRLTHEDKFARRYYCPHARLNQVRGDKKYNKRKLRRISTVETNELIEEDV